MAQLADTYLEAEQNLGTVANADDIRWTEEEEDDIRQEKLTCFAIARRAQRIMKKQDNNPTFSTVEEIMKLMMGLEEQAKEARHNMCQFLQHGPGRIHDKKFHDEVANIRDITEVVVKTSISEAGEFLQSIQDVDGIFTLHEGECNDIIGKIHHYTKKNREREQPSNTALATLIGDLKERHESMKCAWSKIIQCAIDYENPTVFYEVSVRVWATGDSVDEAIAEAKHAINSQEVKGKPQVDERHLPPQGGKETKVQTKEEMTTGIDKRNIELSAKRRAAETTQRNAETMKRAIEQVESAERRAIEQVESAEKRAIEQVESAESTTQANITHAGGGEEEVKKTDEVKGAEDGMMVARCGRSQTDGRGDSGVTRKPKGEEQADAEERAYMRESEIELKSRAGERHKAEEQPRGEAEILRIGKPKEKE